VLALLIADWTAVAEQLAAVMVAAAKAGEAENKRTRAPNQSRRVFTTINMSAPRCSRESGDDQSNVASITCDRRRQEAFQPPNQSRPG
jgi:hypothetical protein